MTKVSASELLDRFWNGVLPIDPKAIAEAVGVKVVPLTENDVQKGLSGALHFHTPEGAQNAELYCRYNDLTESPERQRFTIAHELGHYASGHISAGQVLFRDTTETFTGRVYDPQEVEANRFAAELLMPEKYIQNAIQRDGIKTVQDLAKEFGVSASAMRWRLVNLGLLSKT